MATVNEPIKQAGYISATFDFRAKLTCETQPVHTLSQTELFPFENERLSADGAVLQRKRVEIPFAWTLERLYSRPW
jgi:hypothetical protein